MNPEFTAEPRWRTAGRAVLGVLIECGGALAGQPPFSPAPDHDENNSETQEGDGAS
ncbi:hypothetical protein [Amycolatopsis sp. WQ 127309]|uniref:hypothetical protein n=1 Tax=Amycolatopsis sp. WQ 127309 TaxID=2932773 RepID=UPI001FF58EA9|nr:hypothetical protein [Amycolatopsis sp. WQ 127309]UOZ08276.1 hypothetical protein MUY22_08380 [Amycolatopsis sp. WQ 127309]